MTRIFISVTAVVASAAGETWKHNSQTYKYPSGYYFHKVVRSELVGLFRRRGSSSHKSVIGGCRMRVPMSASLGLQPAPRRPLLTALCPATTSTLHLPPSFPSAHSLTAPPYFISSRVFAANTLVRSLASAMPNISRSAASRLHGRLARRHVLAVRHARAM